MKAIIWTGYGPPDVLQLREVARPEPRANELLVQVRATTVTTGDCELRAFTPAALAVMWLPLRLYMGLRRPTRVTILGQELAGVVAAVGKEVTRFKEGDPVYAATGCNLGAYAEYTCLMESGSVAPRPANVSFEEAAALPLGGLETWQYLKSANLQPGQQILINGAGGSIGTIAVQLASHFGAEVTAVDRGEKLAMLREIGAEAVIDYRQEDFSRSGRRYDLVFDVIGTHSPLACAGVLKVGGRYLTANPGRAQQMHAVLNIMARPQVVRDFTRRRHEDLLFLKELVEAGAIRAVIDRRYPLAEAAAAHRYVETGLKKGSVVLTLAPTAAN